MFHFLFKKRHVILIVLVVVLGMLSGCNRSDGVFEKFQNSPTDVVIVYLGSIGDCVPCTGFPDVVSEGVRDSLMKGIVVRVVGVIQSGRKIALDVWQYRGYFDTLMLDDGAMRGFREDGVRVVVLNRRADVVETLTDQDLHSENSSGLLLSMLRESRR
jgi:hypothetical protein